jgi:S1-C subfamily serine protease
MQLESELATKELSPELETHKLSSVVNSSSDDSPRWHKTLDRVVSAIVAIKFSTVRHFDTERAGYGVATGFVVDKKRGLILTNRHVVRPGPVTAEAIFLDHEEVPLYPIYRDPVHDFGFYRFNPADVKFMEVSEITLAPDEARIGTEIRIIGFVNNYVFRFKKKTISEMTQGKSFQFYQVPLPDWIDPLPPMEKINIMISIHSIIKQLLEQVEEVLVVQLLI